MKRYLWSIGIASCIIVGLYILEFHYGVSDNPVQWGAFGDYLSGTLTIIILVFTLHAGLKTYDKDKTINKLSLLYIPALKEISEIENELLLNLPNIEPINVKKETVKFLIRLSNFNSTYSYILYRVGISEDELHEFTKHYVNFVDWVEKFSESLNDEIALKALQASNSVNDELEIRVFIHKIKELISKEINFIWATQIDKN